MAKSVFDSSKGFDVVEDGAGVHIRWPDGVWLTAPSSECVRYPHPHEPWPFPAPPSPTGTDEKPPGVHVGPEEMPPEAAELPEKPFPELSDPSSKPKKKAA